TETRRADASVFWPRVEASKVAGLALAVHVGPGLAGRWVGWLGEGGLGAVACLGSDISAKPPLVKVGLARPVLVEPAVQRKGATPTHELFDWGEALFLVAGERSGAAQVQAFVATGNAITPGPVVPLGSAVPSRVLLRHSVKSN